MTAACAEDRYGEFLSEKLQYGADEGFEPLWVPDFLFPFQRFLVDWNLRRGRSATLADCGLGKTPIELVWSENVARHTGKPVLILTPLAVSKQTLREGEKFGIEVKRSQDGQASNISTYVTNYERLHYFDPSRFGGVVCDESSCIKAFDGTRRAQVTEFLRTIPYRLMATATAAPNDYIELGTTSEALGVMGQVEMLNRFFKNDQNNSDMRRIQRHAPAQGGPTSSGWRFKGHGEEPFWRWVCSFARAGRRPSDFGPFDDSAFQLPPLEEHIHMVETRTLAPGCLFAKAAENMAEEREERNRTIPERCEMATSLVADTGNPFIVWCHLNPEGDMLARLIPDAVHITGSQSDEEKEEKYEAFLSGQARGMISKQRIGGWGLNCQHCWHVVEFVSHSFEAHYQGVRRCWRFGQTHTVTNDLIATEGQRAALESMTRKSAQADRMFDSLVAQMNNSLRLQSGQQFGKETQVPSWL